MVKRIKKTIWRSVLIGSLVFLASGTLGITYSSSDIPLFPKVAEADSQPFTYGVFKRVKAASPTSIPESADAVLIRTKEWQRHRYLKNAWNLPDWIDLGLEHRTRFEVYDHPWRSIQPLGRTDPQIQQRSRVRFGLNGGHSNFYLKGRIPGFILVILVNLTFSTRGSGMNMIFCGYSYPRQQRMFSEPASTPTCVLGDSPWILAIAG